MRTIRLFFVAVACAGVAAFAADVPTSLFELRRGLAVAHGAEADPTSRLALRRGLAVAHGAEADNYWPMHDHDAGAQRFSPLKQITPANVAKLQPAWTFDTGATGIQVTPLVVGGIMYVSAGKDRHRARTGNGQGDLAVHGAGQRAAAASRIGPAIATRRLVSSSVPAIE